MSLRKLRSALAQADLKPHTHTSSFSSPVHLVPYLSVNAFSFLKGLSEQSEFYLLSNEPWSGNLLRRYRQLAFEERLEVLGFLSFDSHELTHRIDMLTTPFGASFHARSCLETIGLLIDGPGIINELQRSDPHLPIRDVPRTMDDLVVGVGRPALMARIAWFDTLRGSSPRHIAAGWGEYKTPMHLLGKSFSRVMVQGLLATIELPGFPNLYLRPQTILESRAIAVSGLKLYSQLGSTEYAANEVRNFITTYYGPGQAHPEYRFLYELYADTFDRNRSANLGDQDKPQSFATMLRMMVIAGWYALHPTPWGSAMGLDVSPIWRLFMVIRAYENVLGGVDAPRTTGARLLEAIDSGDVGLDWHTQPVNDKLRMVADIVRTIRDENRRTNYHDELRAHFEQLLNLNEYFLRARIERGIGYNSHLGMPEDGDLVAGIATIATDMQSSIWEDFTPPDSVTRWFRLRETLLFHHARPAELLTEYWQYASGLRLPDRQIERLPNDALEGALKRARITDGSVWFQVDERYDPDHVVCRIPFSCLSSSFSMENNGDDIQTMWMVLPTVGDVWITLKIDFLGARESLRLLFSVSRHEAYLRRILRMKYIVISREEVDDQGQMMRIGVPVMADPTIVQDMLSVALEEELTEEVDGWTLRRRRGQEVQLEWRVEARKWETIDGFEEATRSFSEGSVHPSVSSFTISLPELRETPVLVACGKPEEVATFWRNHGAEPTSALELPRVVARMFIGRAIDQVMQSIRENPLPGFRVIEDNIAPGFLDGDPYMGA